MKLFIIVTSLTPVPVFLNSDFLLIDATLLLSRRNFVINQMNPLRYFIFIDFASSSRLMFFFYVTTMIDLTKVSQLIIMILFRIDNERSF